MKSLVPKKLHNEITAREDQLRWGCEKSQE
jgi:hypothetical protein